MNTNSKNNLIKTLSIQTVSNDTYRMEKYIIQEVSKINKVDIQFDKENRNIYVTKGNSNIYPCIISHTDTVHDIINYPVIFEKDNMLFAMDMEHVEQIGIGGDDKVGVFITLELLKKFDNIKVAFFSDEEIGCIGSYNAKMTFFENVSFVLQCDRKGKNDFVKSILDFELYSREFEKAIMPILKKHNRKQVKGGLTDVYQLKENGLNISVANMSCGYYNPHSNQECVVIPHVEETLKLCEEIIITCSYRVWKTTNKIENQTLFFTNTETVCEYCNNKDIYPDELSGMYYCFRCQEYFDYSEPIY